MIEDRLYNKRLDNIQSIAIFRALQLGDMLCVIPAVRAIKRAYPSAAITLIGLPWQREFVKRFSHYFSDFIEFPGWPGLPEQKFTINRVMNFLDDVQQRRFDLVLQMQGNGNIVNPMCMLWGAKLVAGLRREDDQTVDPALFPVMHESEHEITRFLKVAEVIGAVSDDFRLEFPVLPEELEVYKTLRLRLGLSDAKYICVHPGARDQRRRWPAEKFASVADALAARGYVIVLTGSVEEREILDRVAALMTYPPVNLVKTAGQVGIGELALLMKDGAGLLSNDTGVSHVASALHIPSVILFSAFSDPRRWSPLNKRLHSSVPADRASDAAYVLQVALDQFEGSLARVA